MKTGSKVAPSPAPATARGMDGVVTSYIHPVPTRGDRPAFHSTATASAPRLLEGRKTGSEVAPRPPGETRVWGEQSHRPPGSRSMLQPPEQAAAFSWQSPVSAR